MLAFFSLLAYQLDLFKRPFTLNVMTHQKISSVLGTLFSLGIFAVACLSFFRSNMFLKINPYVLEKTVTAEETPLVDFGNNLPISMFITNTTKEVYKDDTILNSKHTIFKKLVEQIKHIHQFLSARALKLTMIHIIKFTTLQNFHAFRIQNTRSKEPMMTVN